MISNQEYCQEHPNFQIGGIYIGNKNQNFARKVCVECILTQKIPHDKLLSKKEILQQLLLKANQVNMKYVLDQNQCTSLFKPFLNQFDLIEQEIDLIFMNIRDSIKRIQDDLISEDNKFLNLLKNDLNPFECSQQELDFLVDFLVGNNFEEQINKKKMVTSVMQKVGLFLDGLIQYLFKSSHLIGEIHNILQKKLITFRTIKKKEELIIDLEGLQQFNNQLVKTPFILIKQINRNKIYKKDGQILRIEKYILGQKDEKILINLEQIKHLEFKGQYGINGNKLKQWNYYWRGEKIGGGNFNIKGQKEGKWLDLCDNYWDQKNIIEEGYYQEDKRIGDWKIQWNNQTIGGGSYDNQRKDQKIGRWIELSEHFCVTAQVTYQGEYKNGKKFGSWDIWYNNGKNNQKIGGGSYDNEVDGMKIGKWIDISEGFYRDCQVTYNGEYKNGKRIGKWDIWYQEHEHCTQNTKIGGGQYDEGGLGIKTGKWIDIVDGFYDDKQVTYSGGYKNGEKVGRWEIWFKEHGYNKQNNKMQIFFYQVWNFKFLVVVDHMMKEVQALKLESGLIQLMDLNMILKQLIKVNIKMAKNLVVGIYGIIMEKMIKKCKKIQYKT
ncbi:unnamed protein product [Paramecium pentaurelia]|uniref:Uncharacterized protein n=1 Tax=Paramecium pentaurelia TaxID=43138 RepID=A0A8S1XD74_9CILI|nr:unnamed protein product [Paramecium pentaurelia]